MRHYFRHALILSAISVSGFSVSLASAQSEPQPGSNVPTPMPAQPQMTPPPAGMEPLAPPPMAPDTSMTVPMVSDPNEPRIDTETTRRTFPNRPLLATSTALLGLSYGATAITGAASDTRDDKELFYPVAGPWMEFGDEGHDAFDKFLLGTSGVLQGLGALGMLSSLFIPEKRTQNWYLIGSNALFRVSPEVNRTTYGPNVTGYNYGLSANGRF